MNSEELKLAWQSVCDQVSNYDAIDASQMNAFFSRLQPQAMSDGFLMLTADNDFIKTWIEKNLIGTTNPRQHGKGLMGNKSEYWRYRVGDYRILAEIRDAEVIIIIVEVGHRREIYKR